MTAQITLPGTHTTTENTFVTIAEDEQSAIVKVEVKSYVLWRLVTTETYFHACSWNPETGKYVSGFWSTSYNEVYARYYNNRMWTSFWSFGFPD